MMTIWKFTLEKLATQIVPMPRGAQLLCAREQGENICVWAIVDPNGVPEPKTFNLYGTGHEMSANGKYIGTGVLYGGRLVFHVFEAGTQ